MGPLGLNLCVIFLSLGATLAKPEADPGPDADPDALPNLCGGGGCSMMPALPLPAPVVTGGLAEMIPSPVVGQQCGMVDQCCGMADQGCCMSQGTGQQCYTTWERKCTYANKPVCQTQTKEFCDTHPIKECRYTKKPEYVNVPVNKCTPKMERKCFNYTGKSCKPINNQYTATFNWTNEELSQDLRKPLKKCHSVKTCKVTERMETRTRKVPKQDCRQVPVTKKDCQSVPVPQPPITVPTTEYTTQYRQQCYKVPKPVCRMEPCTYQVQTQTICPTCVMPGQPSAACGDQCGGVGGGVIGTPPIATPYGGVVSNPCAGDLCGGGIGGGVIGGGVIGGGVIGGGVIGGGSIGGGMCLPCRQQNVQMCTKMTQKCEMTYENVCQQVPIRVPVQGTKTVQPPPRYEMKCEDRVEYTRQCKTIYVDEPMQVPVKSCQDGMETKCYTYEVPEQSVNTVDESESVNFPSADCTIEETPREHCTMLPTELICSKSTERRGVLITQRKCDRVRQARYCNILPFSYCQNNPGQECTMVPREVCQPTCQQSQYCNQCIQFANSGGFSQCSTQTCPNFYSPGASCPLGLGNC